MKLFLIKQPLILIIVLTCLSCATTQEPITNDPFISIEKITNLDNSLYETSGLIYYQNHLYTVNDSGNPSHLYKLSTDGQLINQITLPTITNTDWESLTISNEHFYIADIGNNNGTRQDLKIYQTAINNLINNQWDDWSEIPISYELQSSFLSAPRNTPYDSEAITIAGDNSYLFTKDWAEQSTTVYRIHLDNPTPLTDGIHIPVKGLVTGATVTPQNYIMLCGYNESLNPFIARIKIEADGLSWIEQWELPIEAKQTEAITYYKTQDDGTEYYFISSEGYHINLGTIQTSQPPELFMLQWRN